MVPASCARDAGIAKTATRKKAKMKNRLNFMLNICSII